MSTEFKEITRKEIQIGVESGMRTFYHITSEDRLPSIMSKGLVIGSPGVLSDEDEREYVSNIVMLTRRKYDAESEIFERPWYVNPKRWVILRVTVPSNWPIYLDQTVADGGYYYSTESIPPSYIKVAGYKDDVFYKE